MNKKISLLHIPVFLSACLAILRLAGLPGQLHLTAARLLFIQLTVIGCVGWVLFLRKTPAIAQKTGIRALVVHTSILISLTAVLLISAGNKLAVREGLLYSIGAFIRQASPFLVFLAVLCSCAAAATAAALRAENVPLHQVLFGESFIIPEITLVFVTSLLLFGAYFPLRENYYPSHDYSIFAYIGQQILRGRMPYTELWDHKPPLIFYFDALGLKLAGGSLIGIWLLEFAFFFIGSLLFFAVLKRFFPERISLPVLLCGMIHYARVLDFGNYTEEISLFFVCCSLFLVYSLNEKQSPIRKGIISGILCGLAFTCKQNTVGCWAALFLLDLIRSLPARHDPELFRNRRNFWLSAAFGFILVNTVWVVYFAVNHALTAYWEVAFRFNFIYSEHSGENRLATAWTTLTFLPSVSPYLLLAFLSWIPALVSALRTGIRGFSEKRPLSAWALIDLPIELFFAGLSGMNYQHYFILCIPPAIVLLCAFLEQLVRRIHTERFILRAGIPVLLCAASLTLIPVYRENYTPRTPSAYTKARDFLLKETVPEEPILVWGSRSAIYVMSERYAPTAYFNERPLYLFPGEVQSEQWDELLDDLRSDPPQAVIWTHDSALPFIENNGESCFIPEGADYTKPVYIYFCDHYVYDTTINEGFKDAWEVYRRR